jgi:hypothetical protein
MKVVRLLVAWLVLRCIATADAGNKLLSSVFNIACPAVVDLLLFSSR